VGLPLVDIAVWFATRVEQISGIMANQNNREVCNSRQGQGHRSRSKSIKVPINISKIKIKIKNVRLRLRLRL
jgi:hypothetical protein